MIEEWMKGLRLKVAKCNYKENDRNIKEQFINGMNDDSMMDDTIRKLMAAKNICDITSDANLA